MFPLQRIGADKNLSLLQSHLTQAWMPIVSIPIADTSQMLVGFVDQQRGFRVVKAERVTINT